MSVERVLNLLGLAGSLRRESHSMAILRGLQARLGPDRRLYIGDIRLPLYNEDEEGHGHPPVIALRREIAACDGVILATPEYNYGMPGLLKNAIDWASRPYGASALTGKPVLVISSSLAFTGGVRAHAQLNDALLSLEALLVPGPQAVIGGVADKVDQGRLVDEASLDFLVESVERMVAMRRMAPR
uniref:NADPH-dependent FMN reductase n=1 Tax=Sphingomonas bacterium TaxID=1895847 RepID=UPI002626AD05|nr:NAD(P)H-dependent oxidoreductase [Sphingomonas bacterium]